MVMSSERAFAAFDRNEIEIFRDAFIFYTKIRKSVKIRYADALDNSEYEPQMRNLLDNYMYVKDVQQVYEPIDILDIGNFEKSLERMPSSRSKADAIASHLAKSIKLNHDDDPAFYESFSKRIKDALEDFRNKVLSEIEYLKRMKEILSDFRKGDTKVQYPHKIKGDLDAQAFYGVVSPLIADIVGNTELVADIVVKITSIIRDHDQVDWKNNNDIHNSIKQDIDDLFYDIEQEKGIKVDFDTIDKISDSVINIALRRF